jgi:pyrroline-5-carboxylate reductase
MRITFIGGGNMAKALLGGLIAQGYSPAGMQVVEPYAPLHETINQKFGVQCVSVVDASALLCDTVVLAVKPQQMSVALAPLCEKLEQQLVLSIAAGVRLTDISRWLGGYRRLIRAMPNTPALIGKGVSGLFAEPSVDQSGRLDAERILNAVGSTLWLHDEAQMDAVTAISGSGPAYVFYFIEAVEAAARQLGFDESAARKLTIETFIGAAQLAAQSPETISTLRQQVTSKGGTTEAALESFAVSGVAAQIALGIQAAALRGRELGNSLSRDEGVSGHA